MDREGDARVIPVAVHVREIERHIGAAAVGDCGQFIQRRTDPGQPGQPRAGTLDHVEPAVEPHEFQQGGRGLGGHAADQPAQRRLVLGAEGRQQVVHGAGGGPREIEQRTNDAGVAEIQMNPGKAGEPQRCHGEFDHLGVGFSAGQPVEFGAHLQRLARRQRVQRSRMQHAAGIAEPRHALAVEDVGVDPRHLRRRIRPQSEHPAARLVGELEHPQVEVAAGSRQERVEVLDQRRNDQFVTVAAIEVEQRAPQFLHAPGLERQHVGDVFGKEPARHGDIKRRRSGALECDRSRVGGQL